MDFLAHCPYTLFMVSRILALLAVFAIAVATTVATAHAARMREGAEHTAHAVATVQSADGAVFACDAGQPCPSADLALCKIVCMSLSALLTLAGGQLGHVPESASHDLPPDTIPVGRAPGLIERPPKLRLL